MDDVRDRVLGDAKRFLSYPPAFRRGVPQLEKPLAPASASSYIYKISADFWERLISCAFTLATSATAGQRSLSLNFADGDGFIFNQTQIAADIGPSVTTSQYGDMFTDNAIQGQGSLVGEGSVTTPAAGGTIASITSVPAGTYNVTVVLTLSGTLTAGTDNNNTQLTSTGSPATINLDNSIQLQPQVFGPFEVTVPASGTIAVKNIVLATTGAVYSAQVNATPLGVSGSFIFPDLILASGWQITIALGSPQTGDQLSGIGLYVERYDSKYARGGYYGEFMAAERHLAAELSGGWQ